ncbi:MAG: penicillin-binding protein 2 [Coriobacteriales bacterium]|jgi:cell division protein FtsI (penicillin-binding protein 3)|nr:penicillin-binding protein 2 [Coriobacteriales bacterium]
MDRQDPQARSSSRSSHQKASLTKDGRVVGSNREAIIFLAFCLVAAVLIGRLVYLQVVTASTLREEAQSQRTVSEVIPAKRGTIYDRNGNVLAMSIDAVAIYANPKEIVNPQATAAILAEVLGGDINKYHEKLVEDTTFVYILRQADVDQAERLKERGVELQNELDEARAQAKETAPAQEGAEIETPKTALFGINYLQDTKRVYPYGSIGGQVIGMVDVDSKGLFGLEHMYDSMLSGSDGKLTTEYSLQNNERPRSGQPIPGSMREEIAPVNGKDIIISLDIDLQQYVESELVQMGKERESENGSALVLDGANGEIYAMASLPLFDRNNLTAEAVEQGATTLKAICFSYEPGSIFKPLTAAAVLEEGAMLPEDQLFVPAYRTLSGYTISDSHARPDETMSFRKVIADSSNVGISLIKDKIGDATYAPYLERFGIGLPTHVDFPGESVGSLAPVGEWSDIQAANISFGQGVAVSPLQMASFYGAVVNDGIKCQPHFLTAQPQTPDPSEALGAAEQIMKPETATTLTSMLTSVVTDGTGHAAKIEGYSVAGKTGTAQKASPDGGYMPDNYIVSFVGFLANSKSKLVCITSMDNPIGAEGNAPTGPLFASIMQFAANRYMIEPGTDFDAEQAADQKTDVQSEAEPEGQSEGGE